MKILVSKLSIITILITIINILETSTSISGHVVKPQGSNNNGRQNGI